MSDRQRLYDVDTRLIMLRAAHRALEERLADLLQEKALDFAELQRLKKQKLALKDRIAMIERERHPDIIA